MSANRQYAYEPDYAVPPGETLQEIMASLGMSQKELAVRTGLTAQTLARVFKGEQPITYETANKLDLATGVPSRLWNNLETQYREQLSRLGEKSRLEQDTKWLKTIPVAELQARGFVEKLGDKALLLRDVLAFYGVASVSAWRSVWESPEVSARRSPCFETRPGPASAWIRQGELQAQNIACAPYDRGRFQHNIALVPSITKEEPRTFAPKLQALCEEAGVAVVFVREMNKVPWNGAMRWLNPHKAMILLCLRGKGEDRFWFSFFHEAGHVLHDGKKDLFINNGDSREDEEKKADKFASEFLIPTCYAKRIQAFRHKAEIIALAEELDIAPGLVAGRYQHLTGRWSYFKDVIRAYCWKDFQTAENATRFQRYRAPATQAEAETDFGAISPQEAPGTRKALQFRGLSHHGV